MSDFRLGVDVETRSAVNLPKAGAFRYFEDETTDVLCCSTELPNGQMVNWTREQDCPDDVSHAIRSGEPVYAWNATFEWLAFKHILGPRYGWPVPKIEQMRDTMAYAAAMQIPQGLDMAAKALGLEVEKDKEGKRLINKFSKPRRARKNDIPGVLYWNEPEDHPEDFHKFSKVYCPQDVVVEREVRKRLVPLSDYEQQVWEFTLKINDRGIRVDMPLVEAMLNITDDAKALLDKQMRVATSGEITACSQVSALTAWLKSRGVETDSLDKNAILTLLADDLPDDARAAILLRQEAAKTSTAKLTSMKTAAGAGERVRGCHSYHGAGTGRWAGRLLQCVTGDHEVLTRNGWVPIEKAVGPCEIMAWSPKTKTMRWESGVINRFHAPEKIAQIDSCAISGTYTLDHRMPNIRPCLSDWTPQKLLSVKRRDGFLISAPVDQPDSLLSDNQIRLLVAMQADGTFAAGALRGRVVFRFSKTRKCARLRSILNKLNINYTETRHPCAPEVLEFAIRPHHVPDWLVKDFGTWVLSFSERQARLAFYELRHWDGFKHQKSGSVCLMSPRKDQVLWMATIAALAGVPTSVNWYMDRTIGGRWSLYERKSKTTTIRAHQVSVSTNDRPVFCPTLPSGYWLCRYKTRTYITGNTQNMPRGTGTVKEPEKAKRYFRHGKAPLVDMLFGSPMSACSDMLRSCLIASEGNRLLAADYSSIEGRVTAWVAGEQWVLKAYRANDAGKGEEMYKIAASGIFGVPAENVTGDQRQVGKASELALGFGGGVMAYDSMAKIYGIDMAPVYPILERSTDPEIWERGEKRYAECLERGDTGTDFMSREAWIASEITKVLWRDKHPATVELWQGLQDAAFDAVANPGLIHTYGPISYIFRNGFLWCRLPSGRCLAYGNPKIQDRETPWGETRPAVTAMTVDSVTKRWTRAALYGGLLTENVVQAIARDLMAHGMLVAEAAGYPMIMTVHDEGVADVPVGFGSLAEYESLLCDLPPWAVGIPLVASGYEAQAYKKD